MLRTKPILAFVLSVILILCTVAVSFAEEMVGVSLSASKDSVSGSITKEQSESFSLYFGMDKFSLGEKVLNTYKFTVWFNESYVKLDGDIVSASDVLGKEVLDEKTEKEFDGVTYTGQTFTFASFDKGFGTDDEEFNVLARIPFKTKESVGKSKIFITAEDVLLLPVASKDNFEDVIPFSLGTSEIEVTVEEGDGGGGFFGGSTPSAVKRTVVFDVDGKRTSVSVTDGKKVGKPQDPVKEGHTFLGWYKEKTFETLYNFNDEVIESLVLYAKFAKNEVDVPVSALPFKDVAENDWFYQGVKYVFEKNMVKGISETQYGPNVTLNRATLVTLIYRLENEPSAPANEFSDVLSGAWYENAVAWASANEIVLGVGEGLFAPETNITREQIAVILYKYTKFKGGDVSKTADLNAFSDAEKISDWAKDALSWAVAEGLIQGMGDGSVAPNATATRAQIATILMRYMK